MYIQIKHMGFLLGSLDEAQYLQSSGKELLDGLTLRPMKYLFAEQTFLFQACRNIF